MQKKILLIIAGLTICGFIFLPLLPAKTALGWWKEIWESEYWSGRVADANDTTGYVQPTPDTLWGRIVLANNPIAGLFYGQGNSVDLSSEPTLIVASLVRIVLALVGVLFVALLVYGGYLWIWARGNEEKVKKARGIVKDSVIGLVIIFSAYAFTWTITKEFYEASSGLPTPYTTRTQTWPYEGFTGEVEEGTENSGWDKGFNP